LNILIIDGCRLSPSLNIELKSFESDFNFIRIRQPFHSNETFIQHMSNEWRIRMFLLFLPNVFQTPFIWIIQYDHC